MSTNHTPTHPQSADRDTLKTQAKRLRKTLEAEGNFISHSDALELIAKQHGFRNWNTLSARLGSRPQPEFKSGDRVSGCYLGQDFTGTVLAAGSLNAGRRYDLTIAFDHPVDVVRFDSFSAYRHRVRTRVGSNGRSDARTSNGQPHMVLAQH